MPPVGVPAVCLLASVISVGPALFSLAFFLVFPGLLSSVSVCVCVQKPGRAAAAYVHHKHQTYPAWRNPTEDLVPFILESFGNPSVKAVNFLRHMAPADRGLRSLELRRAYRELSCLTQQRLAHLLRSAEDNARPN